MSARDRKSEVERLLSPRQEPLYGRRLHSTTQERSRNNTNNLQKRTRKSSIENASLPPEVAATGISTDDSSDSLKRMETRSIPTPKTPKGKSRQHDTCKQAPERNCPGNGKALFLPKRSKSVQSNPSTSRPQKQLRRKSQGHEQMQIRFRYSTAVGHFAHRLIADIPSSPNVTVAPAPPPSADSPVVHVHHPEKVEFERVFTTIVPVSVENGRLCITPKPGRFKGERTELMFSYCSHESENTFIRSLSCAPSEDFQETSDILSPNEDKGSKRVCFCLPVL